MHASAKRQRSRRAAPSALFEVVRAEGRTGDGGVPLLCLTLRGVEPFRVALRPVDVLALGNFLNAQRPLAARRVQQAAIDRDQRVTDDLAEERAELSSTARLLAR